VLIVSGRCGSHSFGPFKTDQRGPVAARQSTRRKLAMAMARALHRDTEAARRSLAMWCPVRMIVKRPADVEVLAFAVARGWLELSPDAQSVRVTNEGSRLME
jgi:hypothetical protein